MPEVHGRRGLYLEVGGPREVRHSDVLVRLAVRARKVERALALQRGRSGTGRPLQITIQLCRAQ